MRGPIAVVVLLLAACRMPGERAATCPNGNCPSGTTSCPPGETCSDKTPDGLYFSGASTCTSGLSGGPMATANGGTQLIVIDGLDGLPYDVAVDGDAFTVADEGSSSVRITGVADGTAELRVLEPGTDLLYDRIALSVATATTATIASCDLWDDGATTHALWGGSDQTAAVVLTGAGGAGPLADDRMQLQTPVGAQPRTWDTFLALAPIATGPLAIDATLSSGAMFHPTVEVTDRADDIAWVATLFQTPPSAGVGVDGTQDYTFEILDGATAIAGVPITATVDAPLAPVTKSSILGNIVAVQGAAPGDGHLTLLAGGAQRTFEIPVHASFAAAPARGAGLPRPTAPASAPGERARAADGD